MSDKEEELNTIACDTHGESHPTYICGHLHWNPVQRWHSSLPEEDDRWPDAWCAKCEALLQEAGEWTDEISKGANIVMLCHHCYEAAQARSIEYLAGEALKQWESFLGQCWEELVEKQEKLRSEYKIDVHKRWDWDQDTGELIFSNDGVPAVIAKFEFAGTLSTVSNTWLWAWANFHLMENVRQSIRKVYEFGDEHGYSILTASIWNSDENDGWEMAAVAAHLLNAHGVYRSPDESGFSYLVITDIRWACKPGAGLEK